jgi:hypothetical protein
MPQSLADIPVEDAVTFLVKRAAFIKASPRYGVKQAEIPTGFGKMVADAGNWIKENPIPGGAAVGAVGGGLAGLGSGLFSRKKNRNVLGSTLTGALGGAALGTGAGAAVKMWPHVFGDAADNAVLDPETGETAAQRTKRLTGEVDKTKPRTLTEHAQDAAPGAVVGGTAAATAMAGPSIARYALPDHGASLRTGLAKIESTLGSNAQNPTVAAARRQAVDRLKRLNDKQLHWVFRQGKGYGALSAAELEAIERAGKAAMGGGKSTAAIPQAARAFGRKIPLPPVPKTRAGKGALGLVVTAIGALVSNKLSE